MEVTVTESQRKFYPELFTVYLIQLNEEERTAALYHFIDVILEQSTNTNQVKKEIIAYLTRLGTSTDFSGYIFDDING